MSAWREYSLPLAGLAIGAWAMLPPYVGPGFAIDPRVEFVDHIVPGLVVLAVSAAVLVAGRRATRAGTAMFAAGLAIVLAGLWMVSTHVPLVAQALRNEAPAVATVWHSVPGLVVVTLGAVWAFRHSSQPTTGDARSD